MMKRLLATLFLPCSAILAQNAESTQSVTITPQPRYEAHGLKEKFLGSGWRELWTTGVRAPLLRLDTYAGGVKITERGGGQQSLSLHLQQINGWKEYGFKSVDKFPLLIAMPPALRNTTSGDIVQDEVSMLMPAAPIIVHPIMDAIHALNVPAELRTMADDPKLGVYRDTFALMLGTVELSPQEGPEDSPGFAGSTKIEGADDFIETLEESKENTLDERELFAIRLVDFIINDNDRSLDNMRVARFGEKGNYVWRPISRDRDRAFTNGSGWLIKWGIRPIYPKYVPFNDKFGLDGLVWESWPIDRRLLQRIDRPTAREIAQRVQSQVSDNVIEQMIAQLPREWRDNTDAPQTLRTVLRARRDMVPQMADEFYEWLATEVDVHGTDEGERAEIERSTDGRVTVTLTGSNDRKVYYRRTFVPDETNEVRVYLHKGKDIATVRGPSNSAITVRVIGGAGDDELVDGTDGKGVHFYDSDGDNRFVTARHTSVNEKEWTPPKPGLGVRFDSPWRPDWGKSSGFGPSFDFVHGGGLLVGAGLRYKSNGFRQLPHRTQIHADFLVGTGNGRTGLRLDADHRRENSPLEYNLAARATRFEAFSFYGFGNATPQISSTRALVNQNLVAIEPTVMWNVGWRSREEPGSTLRADEKKVAGLLPWFGTIEAGPAFYWTRTLEPTISPFASANAGNDNSFSRAGARAGFELERVARGSVPDRGVRAVSEFSAFPAILDVDKSFGTAQGAAMAYIPLGLNGMHVGLRAGGAAATDGVPILHSPAIGGRETVRGYNWRRYAGDRAAFGSAELRVPVGEVPFLIRWKVGAFGLVDAGRVWFKGESTDGWHKGVGGGLWFSTLGQTLSVAYAHGNEGHFYLTKGMSF
jgi:hypothetical protein